jgi:hypothetical protein
MKQLFRGLSSALALGAIAVLLGSSSSSALFASSTDTFRLMEGCSYHCRDCSTETATKHDIVTHYSNNQHWAAHLENCTSGSCDGHNCSTIPEGSDEELSSERMIEVSLESDAEHLAELIAQHPSRVMFNSERQALQLYCVRGEIVASLPLADGIAAELEGLLEDAQK